LDHLGLQTVLISRFRYRLKTKIMLKTSQPKGTLPIILAHGGAGRYGSDPGRLQRRRDFLREVVSCIWPHLRDGQSALDATTRAVAMLEVNPDFNAGLGAVLQNDGLARLSASVMDGERRKFSGVMLATHVINPSRLARALQNREESVLGPLGAQLLARELGIPPQYPITAEKARQWAAGLEAAPQVTGHGTVGAVALDRQGRLAAATSTGGHYQNTPERISDSATVAGNYASEFAAIGCTGFGEQIVDDGLAVRLETRVRDGMTIIAASDLAYEEAGRTQRDYGWIGIDREANWVAYCTSEAMPCAAMSEDRTSPIVT
jgi:L-asparaginase